MTESYRSSVMLTLSLAAVSGKNLGEGANSISALRMGEKKGGKTDGEGWKDEGIEGRLAACCGAAR